MEAQLRTAEKHESQDKNNPGQGSFIPSLDSFSFQLYTHKLVREFFSVKK